jgi:endonuclease/exonuclease/phosphatase family metal-dependent hydrolase
MLARVALLMVLTVCASCRTGRNYDGPGPRYVGVLEPAAAMPARVADTLLIVSFNIQLAARPDSALAALRADSLPRGIDILLLQEVDTAATQRIAGKLGMSYVYYPAIFRTRSKRDFGNAVLSRWPIVEDAKLILPHRSWYGGSQRTATAATIRAGQTLVRVYSAHLGTPADITPSQRRNQVRAIVADGARYPRVVIGGDFNSSSAAKTIEELGYAWATRSGPKTTAAGRWDHILLKGLTSPARQASGTVIDDHNTGDHRAVWALAVVR